MSIGLRKKWSKRALPLVIALSALLSFGAGNVYADPHGKPDKYEKQDKYGKQDKYDKQYKYGKPPKYDKSYQHGKVVVVHRPPNYGRTVVSLPPKHHVVHYHGMDYYYHGGSFYKRGPAGYIVTPAPVGAIIVNLPIGFGAIFLGGARYYYYDNVYYQKVPTGYAVVAPPQNVEVIEQPAPIPAQGISRVAVTAQLLNVRSGPSMGYDVAQQVRQGTILDILGQQGNWFYVRTPSGYVGWVMTDFTAPVAPPAAG